ncbi:hypothetical protein Anas_13880 [Armadillidium nasatum]|uniref:Uncharacterized protein n=2 Tax=Armadillidium nasatum TaxID=96803 RepID=A0A5N5T8A3_9CRUS|nr:hypothetical protein Anas_13880 [Armadillidium nasatum]
MEKFKVVNYKNVIIKIILLTEFSSAKTSAKESRCLYNPFGESILPQDSFWFMVKSLQEVRCCVTLQTYFIVKTLFHHYKVETSRKKD